MSRASEAIYRSFDAASKLGAAGNTGVTTTVCVGSEIPGELAFIAIFISCDDAIANEVADAAKAGADEVLRSNGMETDNHLVI